MLQKEGSSNSSASSEYDFGFGEILEYSEELDHTYDNFTFTDPFISSSSFDAAYDVHTMQASSFDGKGKGRMEDVSPLDQYHPEMSKREVMDLVERSLSNAGEIKTSQLRHSSEQWSNYRDLCDSVKRELRRNGYDAATVDCVDVGAERHIVYRLS